MKPFNLKLLLIIMCGCVFFLNATVLYTMWLRDKARNECLTKDRQGLYTIMALQYFSFRYGLPSRFSVTGNETNNLIHIHIFAREKSLGFASVKSTFSFINPEIMFSDCITEKNSIPCEIVGLALLWRYEKQGGAFLKDGFNVDVKASADEFFIFVSSHSSEIGGDYMVRIDKKYNIITGDPGH